MSRAPACRSVALPVLCATAVVLGAGMLLAGQDVRPQPRFRGGVDLVMVDVSVLDKDRQPVRGLLRDRFTVFEDGEPREIVAFSEVEVPGAEALPTGWMRDVAPDVKTNSATGSRILLLVFDDGQISMSPHHAAAARAIGNLLVDQLGPDDLAAVVFTRDNRNAMDFTSDRARLRAAIDRFHSGGDDGMGFLFNRYSTGVLKSITNYLAEIRDRRRAVVYISPGVAGTTSAAGGDPELYYRTQDAIREARRANITFYPIDPRGLVGLDFEAVGAAIREAEEGADVMQVARDAVNAEWDSMNSMNDHLHVLAENTGGFVVGNSNTFAGGVAQIFRESSSYYLLGFRRLDPPDGKNRRLEVHVDYPGALVHARSGYSEPKPPKAGKEPTPTAQAISGLLPATDLPIRAVATPFAIGKQKKAAVIVTLGLQRPVPQGAMKEQVKLLLGAFDPEGRSRASRTLTGTVTLRPVGAGTARYELLGRIDLDPGRYQMRVSAESLSLGQTGSVYFELMVPDFKKEPVSLSGVVLEADPALPSAGRDELSGVATAVPTTQREFQGHRGRAYVRVYQNPKDGVAVPVELVTRIVDERGDPVLDRTDVLDVWDFDESRAADYSIDLPVTSLAPGPYLLTFEATLGDYLARREVRFSVDRPAPPVPIAVPPGR